ncbi:16S rRNA (guanine(966)-N(2))-methyltransferase RsmD [Chloroflexota bacterium]
MRVIAGTAKGAQLLAVPGSGTRPISDRVKEALFNILAEDLLGADLLDLFAGTGSVGIEALSRGARRAVFVEKRQQAVSTIRANLQRTHFEACGNVVKADVFRFLERRPEPFHIIYIAPPQYLGLWAQTLSSLDACPAWLTPDGLVVVQIFPKELTPMELGCLTLFDQRKYGSTLLCFYQRNS